MFADPHLTAPMLNVAFFHAPLVVLGPGRRVGIWLRGCSLRCPGCLAPELWDEQPADRRPVATVGEYIINLARHMDCSGVTISGGEPFEQAAALKTLVGKLRPVLPDILVYSGRSRAEWERNYPWIRTVACLIDAPFDYSLPCEDAWRGSANQGMTLYADQFAEAYNCWKRDRKGRLQFSAPTGRVLGIPNIETSIGLTGECLP